MSDFAAAGHLNLRQLPDLVEIKPTTAVDAFVTAVDELMGVAVAPVCPRVELPAAFSVATGSGEPTRCYVTSGLFGAQATLLGSGQNISQSMPVEIRDDIRLATVFHLLALSLLEIGRRDLALIVSFLSRLNCQSFVVLNQGADGFDTLEEHLSDLEGGGRARALDVIWELFFPFAHEASHAAREKRGPSWSDSWVQDIWSDGVGAHLSGEYGFKDQRLIDRILDESARDVEACSTMLDLVENLAGLRGADATLVGYLLHASIGVVALLEHIRGVANDLDWMSSEADMPSIDFRSGRRNINAILSRLEISHRYLINLPSNAGAGENVQAIERGMQLAESQMEPYWQATGAMMKALYRPPWLRLFLDQEPASTFEWLSLLDERIRRHRGDRTEYAIGRYWGQLVLGAAGKNSDDAIVDTAIDLTVACQGPAVVDLRGDLRDYIIQIALRRTPTARARERWVYRVAADRPEIPDGG